MTGAGPGFDLGCGGGGTWTLSTEGDRKSLKVLNLEVKVIIVSVCWPS